MMTRGTSAARAARAGIVVSVLVAFGLTSVGVSSASATEADTIAALVNQDRASAGLPALVHNPAIDSVAQQWAQQMAAANAMTHNPDYSSQIPAGWTRAGENVAMGQPTPVAMHDAWMNSPAHRANILGDYTDIGIAFITVNGTTWGVEDFGRYAAHIAVAPAPAPAPVAPAPAAPPPPAAPKAAAPAAPSAPAPVSPPAASPSAAPATRPTAVASAGSGTPATPRASAPPAATPSAEFLLSAATTAVAAAFPIGYVIGGVLVLLGVAGGIYGQMLRRRGRRPPPS